MSLKHLEIGKGRKKERGRRSKREGMMDGASVL